jgi:glycosyltransferase involved in cell wall biosynthesis
MGSFSIVANGFNKGLKEIGCYAEPDDADFVGICDGLNFGFRYKNKKRFIINVWDCINTLPIELTNARFNNSDMILLGLSNQITNLWKKHGAKCSTVMPGCDTDFWKPTVPKNETFTFFFNSFANVRSGLEIALEAYSLWAKDRKDVQLLIQNTSESKVLKSVLQEYKEAGYNINYSLGNRISFEEMRDLYSQSHVSLNVMHHSSWGLGVHEAMACGCIPIIGDFCPSNEMMDKDNCITISPSCEVDIAEYYDKIGKLYGLHSAYGNFNYGEQPRFYDYSRVEYGNMMFELYKKYKLYSSYDYRGYVQNNWSWKQAATNLVKTLQ